MVLHQLSGNNRLTRKYISMEHSINDIDNVSHMLGVLKIEVGENILSSIFQERLSNTQGHYYLIDRNNQIISALDGFIGIQMDADFIDKYPLREQRGSFTATYNARNYQGTYYKLPQEEWLLLGLEPLDVMLQGNTAIRNVLLIAVIVIVLIFLIAITLFSARILGPLGKLRSLMRKIENEDFNVQFPVKGNDEIALLGQSLINCPSA